MLDGVPTYGENTMAAFRNAQRFGWVLELDTKLTRDGVAVVMHDATLDRTTDCSGRVSDRTAAELANCRVDVLGSPGSTSGGAAAPAAEQQPIPTLLEVLAFARDSGARVNVEIKNTPTDPDFDPTLEFANKVMNMINASRIGGAQVIVQSFWPPNLVAARQHRGDMETSLLTLAQLNEAGPVGAFAAGNQWVSPAWPVSAVYMPLARGLGRKVVPYTLNTPATVNAAAAAGVNELITDDPAMACRTLNPAAMCRAPAPCCAAPRDATKPRVKLTAPAYASDSSRSGKFALRWKGSDKGGSGLDFYSLQVRRLGTVGKSQRGWTTLRGSTRQSGANFTGKLGGAYEFRVRARDKAGNFSSFSTARTVIPLDQTAKAIEYSSGWSTQKRKNAFGGTVAIAQRREVSAAVEFRGTRIALIAPQLPYGGRPAVVLDGKRQLVNVRGSARDRRVVFRSKRLKRGKHELRLLDENRGPVALDGVAITP